MTETVIRRTARAGAGGPPAQSPTTSSPASSTIRYSAASTAFMTSGWGDPEEIPLPPAPPAGRLAARRDLLRARLPGPLPAVVPAGPGTAPQRRPVLPVPAGQRLRLADRRPDPRRRAVLDPGSAAGDVLFLPPPSGRDDGEFYRDSAAGELWVGGRPSLEARAAALGVACRPLAELPAALAAAGRALVPRGFDAEAEQQVDRGRAGAGRRADGDRFGAAAGQGRVGDQRSCARAIDATHRRLRRRGRAAQRHGGRAGLTERHVEGAFFRRARLEGNGAGYHTIAASGPHATILHWNRNDGPLRAGDLLLLDAGVELHLALHRRRHPDLPGQRPASPRCSARCTTIVLRRPGGRPWPQLRPGADYRGLPPGRAPGCWPRA